MAKEPLGIATIPVNSVGAFAVQPQVNEFGVAEGRWSIQHQKAEGRGQRAEGRLKV
ncbi:hypothetical protein [Fischerella sp.]|uniref:hypothetical protein n=1 Tax=Fischerella sp. TaxID=1191 RepID=UPI0025BFBF2C|nr:hypothetical protein [Fischerella sp.]